MLIAELTTNMLLLITPFIGVSSDAFNKNIINEPEKSIIITTDRQLPEPLRLENYVKHYFDDTPILAEIARCESQFTHLGGSGRVVRGIENSADVGVMQINEYYHKSRALRLGLDIRTLEGNLAYAKWLYSRYGTDPWSASKKCWSNTIEIAKIKNNIKIDA